MATSGGGREGDVLRLLSDERRLKVFAAVVLGASNVSTISEATGIDPTRSERALGRLRVGGLVERTPSAGYSAVLSAFRLPPVPSGAPDGDDSILARFVRAGRLVSWPRPRRARLIVLEYLADCFTMGQTYTEAQVNEQLRTFHHDFAAARRYLVDEGFLIRKYVASSQGPTEALYERRAPTT